MDHDGLREYLNSPFGNILLAALGRHRQRAEEEVLRLTQAKQYDPTEIRYRAGIVTGMGLMLNAIDELRKDAQ
jgi:hypothetical protein